MAFSLVSPMSEISIQTMILRHNPRLELMRRNQNIPRRLTSLISCCCCDVKLNRVSKIFIVLLCHGTKPFENSYITSCHVDFVHLSFLYHFTTHGSRVQIPNPLCFLSYMFLYGSTY